MDPSVASERFYDFLILKALLFVWCMGRVVISACHCALYGAPLLVTISLKGVSSVSRRSYGAAGAPGALKCGITSPDRTVPSGCSGIEPFLFVL